MPWYLPWSESIKNRLSRYLLQRYLGQFLEEKLTLDQLTVDLYNGRGTVSDVKLDVQALNELGEQQNFPIEFVDGFISEVSVSIPWSSILRDGSYVEVSGLVITAQPKQRAENGSSMFESMWNSMTSSMQLAEECLKQSAADGKDVDQSQPLEGLELFAQTIDSILSRVKVKFINTTLRIEHVPKDSDSGVAVEFRIKHLDYCDEAGNDPPTPTEDATLPSQQASSIFHKAEFSTKKFYMEGVSVYTDEYPSRARTFSRSVFSTSAGADSNVWSPAESFSTPAGTPVSSSPGSDPPTSNQSLEPDPILVGRFSGRQEVRLKLRQSDGIIGPKVDLEVNLGALTTFLSPRQLHVLMELVHGLATPDIEDTSNVPRRSRCVEKPMGLEDFQRVEQELQHQLHPDLPSGQGKGLQYNQGWSTAALDDSDDDFMPMRGSGGGAMTDSMASMASCMSGSTTSIASTKSGASSVPPSPFGARVSKKRHKPSGSLALDADPTAEVTHFHVRVSSLAVVLLHEDLLTLCVEHDNSVLARSSVQQMKHISEDFFDQMGFFAVTGYGSKDFDEAKKVFERACPMNHVRLLAAPVIVEGNEKKTSQANSVGFTVTAASAELLECLIDKKMTSQDASVEYVELLRFMSNSVSESDPQTSIPLGSQPDFKLSFKYVEKSASHRSARSYTHPHTDIAVSLQQCWSEIDLSIVDRITAVLNPEPLCKRSMFVAGVAKDPSVSQTCFYQAVENPVLPESSVSVKVSCPFAVLKVRFPCPDLRPIHDMDRPPWWKRSVRKDVLFAELKDAAFQTTMNSRDRGQRFEVQCHELHCLFQEGDTDKAVPFAFAQAAAEDKSAGSGFGLPRIVVNVLPLANPGELEELPEREEPLHYSTSDATFMPAGKKEPSPFSSKKIIHESDTPHGKSADPDGKESVVPGNKQEMAEFVEHTSQNSRVQLEISLPNASLQFVSKHVYELIYNRISNDMLLWEPAAPRPKAAPTEVYAGFGQPGSDASADLLQESIYPAFSMCKSGLQYDSDSGSEEDEGVYYSVYEHRQRHKRKQELTASDSSQSKVAVTLTIGQGVVNLLTPVRDSGGNVIPGQHGEIQVHLEDGNIFAVSGFKGKTGLGYVCVQANKAGFYHSGLVSTPFGNVGVKTVGHSSRNHLEPTIYKSDAGANIVNPTNLDMVSVAIKIQAGNESHRLKTFRVAVGVRGATLRHQMTTSSKSWFTQLLDMFDVTDYPVPGYDPCGVLTELHLHLWDCAVDYRPLYLPLKTVVTMGSFSISSNIAAQTSSSTLCFIAEDAALFISDKTKNPAAPVDLRKDYVCVLDMGLFELSLRLCDKSNGQNVTSPRVDLRASNNILNIRTCSDSCQALTELIAYFASDGDLVIADDQSIDTNSSISSDPLLINTRGNSLDGDLENSNVLSKHVHDMMEEAMKETNSAQKTRSQKVKRVEKGVEVFFFPDENTPHTAKPTVELETSGNAIDDDDDAWEDEFCMVDKEAGSGIMSRNGPPEIRMLTEEPVRVIDNHFTIPMGKTDLLKAPKHYPNPVLKYTLREMTIVWYIYGGADFTAVKKQVKIDDKGSEFSAPPMHRPNEPMSGVSFSKSAPGKVQFKQPAIAPAPPPNQNMPLSWQARGGVGRQHNVLMELQLNKVRFQHEVYPETTVEASRQVLLINEVEVRDRLASSQINKFLYQYSSEAQPKQSHANMLIIKAVHMRPDTKRRDQDCCLKVSMLPLRLNIDQDSLLFLFGFFNELSNVVKDEDDAMSQTRHSTPTHQPPVMTVNVANETISEPPSEPQTLLIMLEDDSLMPPRDSPIPQADNFEEKTAPFPIFFRSFIFSPKVPIRLDYQGKHVDMTHGPLAGLLMGLGQLNCSELRLKRLSYRHGLLGFDKLVSYILAEWLNDIKKNQLPSLLGGVGPMHALVQLFQGIRDLFWLPIEQYQKDGRIVRGLQRGANSFTTSTAMAALELANRLVQAIQSTAEMAYDMVSPGPSVRRKMQGHKGKKRRYNQPVDIREGIANAYMLVKEGLGDTAQTIVRVASEEHDQKGMSGAVGGVLRQIPPTVVRPIILATEATSNVLGGMCSQLVPDARREAAEKWRNN